MNFAMKPVVAALAIALTTTSALAEETENAATWYAAGQKALKEAKTLYPGFRRAKNVILFVGDGMGVSTVTAARILDGQMQGKDGEKNVLAIEKLPYLALSKTYSANQQTSDSAPTMTAMVTGVKTSDGVLSINQSVARKEKDNAVIQANKLTTILELAEAKGLSTGVVSTARITHATPGATYAHIAERDWESDANLPAGASVKDIAAQMIDNFPKGDGIEVVLGGGRSKFLPKTVNDPEDNGKTGERKDGRDLTSEWQSKFGGQFVYDKAGFDTINPANTKRLLGLFERSHMEYETDRASDTAGEPSVAEMTEKAIDILDNNKKGYFLMVEAGRIDHGHHVGNAYRALTDTIALDEAVRVAMEKTDPKDTLIIVTADHSHVFTIAGYPKRGNPILGKVVNPGSNTPALAADNMPYTTLSYANGLGYRENSSKEDAYGDGLGAQVGRFADMTSVDTEHMNFHQEALVPLGSETHAGEDVAIYAGGPRAHLFHGVQEQNYIFHVMKDALGL